jgi:hypothetical protein
LGNGELASLAYGSLKELLQIEELYNIEEPRQGGLVARYRFVFGSSSARISSSFGRWFRVHWPLVLTCLFGPAFDVFVWTRF